MTLGALAGLVRQNVTRSKKNFVMSSIGIVVGIATFVFFIGLSEGIKHVVLGKIFLVDQVEVVGKKFATGDSETFMGFGATRPLDAAVVDELKTIAGVRAVYPKMKFTFPTRGYGGKGLFGRDVWAEIVADGIDPELVADEIERPDEFRDWDADIACTDTAGCPAGRTCEAGQCAKMACKYSEDTRLSACPGGSYCAEDTEQCEIPIPVITSNHLLELYNGSLSTALSGASGGAKMPKLSKTTVLGFELNVTLGKSFLGKSTRNKPWTRRVKLVGFSDKAIMVGVTMPLAYVRRLNQRYSGDEAAATFHSIILKVEDQTQVPAIVAKVKDMGFDLAEQTDNAEKAADIIRTVQSVFALVSFVIVGIAAINISQMFFMLIYQRKREIGLLRAVGASRRDVRVLILAEASLIGVIGGAVGAATGFGASRLVDYVANRLPEFPYKPDTFFAFPAWVWLAALGGAVLFCLFGAFFPANAAARQQPAAALTQ